MNKNQLSLIVALAATGAVLAGGWFVGVQPQLALAASNTAQQADIDAANARNRTELRRLETAYRSLDATKAELATLRDSVPSSPDTASLVSEINAAGSVSGVTVTSVTISDPKAYTPVVDPTSGSTASAATGATPSPSATPAPTATPSTPAAPAPYRDAQITSTNFLVVPVTTAVSGSYDQAVAFTQRVQNGSRLFLVNSLAATSGDSGTDPMSDQSWSLSGYVYVLADSATSTPANG